MEKEKIFAINVLYTLGYDYRGVIAMNALKKEFISVCLYTFHTIQCSQFVPESIFP